MTAQDLNSNATRVNGTSFSKHIHSPKPPQNPNLTPSSSSNSNCPLPQDWGFTSAYARDLNRYIGLLDEQKAASLRFPGCGHDVAGSESPMYVPHANAPSSGSFAPGVPSPSNHAPNSRSSALSDLDLWFFRYDGRTYRITSAYADDMNGYMRFLDEQRADNLRFPGYGQDGTRSESPMYIPHANASSGPRSSSLSEQASARFQSSKSSV